MRDKIKSNHKNSVHLVGLYTYCKMMRGAYNIRHKDLFLSINNMQVLLTGKPEKLHSNGKTPLL